MRKRNEEWGSSGYSRYPRLLRCSGCPNPIRTQSTKLLDWQMAFDGMEERKAGNLLAACYQFYSYMYYFFSVFNIFISEKIIVFICSRVFSFVLQTLR